MIYRRADHADITFYMAVNDGVAPRHWRFGRMPPVEGLTPADVGHIVAYVRQEQRTAGIEQCRSGHPRIRRAGQLCYRLFTRAILREFPLMALGMIGPGGQPSVGGKTGQAKRVRTGVEMMH
jgi:hypothetical protein